MQNYIEIGFLYKVPLEPQAECVQWPRALLAPMVRLALHLLQLALLLVQPMLPLVLAICSRVTQVPKPASAPPVHLRIVLASSLRAGAAVSPAGRGNRLLKNLYFSYKFGKCSLVKP